MPGANNKVILITYPNSMGRNISELHYILNRYFREALGGVHLLPFYVSTGDRGFAPIGYQKVDEAFGDWTDIARLAADYSLMADFMLNHISAGSAYYQDFLLKKDASAYRSMFIQYKDFWESGEPTDEQTAVIYKRKPRAPFTIARFPDKSEEKIWCTFGDQQIDLDVRSEKTLEFIKESLTFLAERGICAIRLDAFAYTVKKPGTSCFFVEPEIWSLLEYCAGILSPYGVHVLPEIHEHHDYQLKLAAKGYPVYDFALPMLLLNALYTGKTAYLKNWLHICPRLQYTTLDTHDGIGVADVRGLIPDEELYKTRDEIFKTGANVKEIYSSTRYNNLDVYQINCTYYSALGNDDDAYLLARAVQFFTPGTPMIYYVGLLAGANDVELVERTKEGRDINRHGYTLQEIDREVKRPVVQKLLRLMTFRNTHPAFNGDITIAPCGEHQLKILWSHLSHFAELEADFAKRSYVIRYSADNSIKQA